MRVKEDKDEIAISLQKSVLMKDLAPIIKKLNSYDYRIYYVFFGG